MDVQSFLHLVLLGHRIQAQTQALTHLPPDTHSHVAVKLGHLYRCSTLAKRYCLATQIIEWLQHQEKVRWCSHATPLSSRFIYHPYLMYDPFSEHTTRLTTYTAKWTRATAAFSTFQLVWLFADYVDTMPLRFYALCRSMNRRAAAALTFEKLLENQGVLHRAEFLRSDSQKVRPWVRLAKRLRVWVNPQHESRLHPELLSSAPSLWVVAQLGTQRVFVNVQYGFFQGAWTMGSCRLVGESLGFPKPGCVLEVDDLGTKLMNQNDRLPFASIISFGVKTK